MHICKCSLCFEGSRPEWCISSTIYSRDTPFGRHSTLQGRERSVFNQTNIGTVSRATLGRLLRDGVERVCAFPSATMPSWAETETETFWSGTLCFVYVLGASVCVSVYAEADEGSQGSPHSFEYKCTFIYMYMTMLASVHLTTCACTHACPYLNNFMCIHTCLSLFECFSKYQPLALNRSAPSAFPPTWNTRAMPTHQRKPSNS